MPIYMTIQNPEIKGHSTIKLFPGAFILQSFTWGMGVTSASVGGGAGTGKAHAEHVTVTFENANAALILESLVRGTTHLITIFVEKAGANGELQKSEVITLTDAWFTSFHESAVDPSTITLNITFSEVTYEMDTSKFIFHGYIGP